MRKLLQIVLLAFVASGIGYWAWDKFTPSAHASTVDAPAPAQEATSNHVVVVTYFTTDVRCKSCLNIEKLTRQTIETKFANEAASGLVRLDIRNIDQPENAHFAGDYDLSFKTVVISDQWSGTERSWQKMDDVWKHLSEPNAFTAYLSEAIEQKLSSKG